MLEIFEKIVALRKIPIRNKYVIRPLLRPYTPYKFWDNGDSLKKVALVAAIKNIKAMSPEYFDDFVSKAFKLARSIPVAAEPMAPKMASLGAFTGSVTEALSTSNEVSAEP